MQTFILVLATVFVVYNLLRMYGVFEINKNVAKVKEEVESARKAKKRRQFEEEKLRLYATFSNVFRGILLTPQREKKYQFYIKRLEIASKILNRPYTSAELIGEVWLYAFVSILLIPLTLIISKWFLVLYIILYSYKAVKEQFEQGTLKPVIISTICFIFMFKMTPLLALIPYGYTIMQAAIQGTILSGKILDENLIIDNYFIDLYLLLFSKLRQGSRARLQSTLDNYYFSLDNQTETDELKVMKKFVRHFLNLVALYEDHVAVMKIRDLYPQATIINFCNIASQAMQGIDNYDSLISYKMQLIDRKRNIMKRRAEHLLTMGTRSIYLIWVILVIFIVVGWYSKLPTGFF